jgi:acetyl-CoA/propionyl-CoA carboxylase, biotin carboxylase, biotin carboxyl carrier protein
MVEVDGRRFEVRLSQPEPEWRALAQRRSERVRAAGAGGAGHDAIVSPMQGTVLSVAISDGDEVEPGQVICIVEAMKMENEVHGRRLAALRRAGTARLDRPDHLRDRGRLRTARLSPA